METNKKQKKTSEVKPGQLVIAEFKRLKALDKESAVKIADLRKIPLSSETIAYTMGEYIDKNIIKITDNDRFYFDDAYYEVFKKKTMRKIYLFILFPVVLFLIFYMIVGGGFKAFFD